MFRFRDEAALYSRRQVHQGAQQEISARRGTCRGQVAERRDILAAIRGKLFAARFSTQCISVAIPRQFDKSCDLYSCFKAFRSEVFMTVLFGVVRVGAGFPLRTVPRRTTLPLI